MRSNSTAHQADAAHDVRQLSALLVTKVLDRLLASALIAGTAARLIAVVLQLVFVQLPRAFGLRPKC